MNTPYKKQIELVNGEILLLNPITKEKPYLNQNNSNRHSRNMSGRYIVFNHPLTGEFIGKVKVGGNNRKNTSSRPGKQSRQFHSA